MLLSAMTLPPATMLPPVTTLPPATTPKVPLAATMRLPRERLPPRGVSLIPKATAPVLPDVVTDSELPDSSDDAAQVGSASADADDANVVSAPDDDSPGLKELREELNSQFESIRIVSPGQYELNLMELYEREEYIISLQEDGKYVIEVPDAWDATER
mgnify:CR=1 FL=1